MYRLMLLLAALNVALLSISQEADLSAINLAVVLPPADEHLSENHLATLQGKIMGAAAANGVSADGYSQAFVIYPKLAISSVKESKGGMRSITVVKATLNLYIKQVSNNLVFSSYSKSIEGGGMNKEEAMTAALESIDADDPKLAGFINQAKNKILAYYNTNCSVILANAQSEKGIKNYESALAMLLTVPAQAKGCYDQAQENAQSVFKEMQKYMCAQYLQKARALAADNNYDEALEYLSWVDPTGPCASESKTMINAIAGKVEAERIRRWEFMVTAYRDGISLRKVALQAMTSVALAWIRARTPTVTYFGLIR